MKIVLNYIIADYSKPIEVVLGILLGLFIGFVAINFEIGLSGDL
ncbi:hypothetical protein [Cognatishimia maritima]|nr:hypothetical protein [Cognatishimia maritima]